MTEGSKKILVVDDDEGIRVMVETVLRREQFEVDTARDGFEAIEKLANNDYGTILLDLMMPRVDGLDVLRFLQEKRPDLEPAVIVMTADSPRAAEAARSRNASRFLTKPFLRNGVHDTRQLCRNQPRPQARVGGLQIARARQQHMLGDLRKG